MKYKYPSCRKGDEVSNLYGKRIPDPYRWLEDPDAPEVVTWVKEQQSVAGQYFQSHRDMRDKVLSRLEQLQNYSRTGCPVVREGVTLQSRNTGLQNQDVLFKSCTTDDILASTSALLDLNAIDPAGTTSLSSGSLSDDGKYYAYGLSKGGSDWQELHVREVSSGTDLPDTIVWAKFTGMAWLKDGTGFFYSRYPPPAIDASKAGTETASTQYCMICLHFLGTSADEDLLVWAEPTEPSWIVSSEVTDDGDYLLISTAKGTDPVNRLAVAHLPKVMTAWRTTALGVQAALTANDGKPPLPSVGCYLPAVQFVNSFEAQFEYIANDGLRFLLKTNLDAPKYRIVAADFGDEAAAAAATTAPATLPPLTTVVPEEDSVLVWATVISKTNLLTCHLRHVTHALGLRVISGNLVDVRLADTASLVSSVVEIELPGPGTIAGFSGRRVDSVAFCKFVSFLDPGQILCLDFRAATTSLPVPAGGSSVPFPASVASASEHPLAVLSSWHRTLLAGFDPTEFISERSFVPSTDGKAQLPIFTVRRRTASGGGTAAQPTLLYGYGGFNVNLGPSFSATRLAWLQELNGVYVMAIIRGGGEYGEAWHQAGARFNKQNCFDDFAAVARHLVATGVTLPRSLGILGGSNGGLLTLVCALQNPTLYGAAVAQVPVADMIRYHKWTVGALWVGEYLSADESLEQLDFQLTYSPLHNVKSSSSPGEQLPAMLITTADHDDRVVPAHSYKMAATLQATAGTSPHQTRPLLVRIESNAGHGAGKPTSKVLAELADIYTFLHHELTTA